MVCIGGGGDRESHQRFGQFAGRGNCSSMGLHLFLFSLRPFPLLPLLTISPSFGDWPMWHARFSLGHSLWYKSLLDTWKHSLARLQLSWNIKRITAGGFEPEREHDLSVHSCLSPRLPLCFRTCFLLVEIKWDNNGEKGLVWRKRKLISKGHWGKQRLLSASSTENRLDRARMNYGRSWNT